MGQDLLAYAKDNDIEIGRKARVDCTFVEGDIHPPCDSMQLYDMAIWPVRSTTKPIIGLFKAKAYPRIGRCSQFSKTIRTSSSKTGGRIGDIL